MDITLDIHTRHARTILIIGAVVFLLPALIFGGQELGASLTGSLMSDQVNIREQARQGRAEMRAQRRAYWSAIVKFQQLKRLGIVVPKPDINDPSTVDYILHGSAEDFANPVEEVQEEEIEVEPEEVAEEEEDDGQISSLTTDQLKRHDRALLRRYTRARSCPLSLRDFIPGFWELCKKIVGENASPEPRIGLKNEKMTRSARQLRPAPTLKARLYQMQQQMDPSLMHRRDPGQLPGRPKPYLKQSN